jgi:hypothetical protein
MRCLIIKKKELTSLKSLWSSPAENPPKAFGGVKSLGSESVSMDIKNFSRNTK